MKVVDDSLTDRNNITHMAVTMVSVKGAERKNNNYLRRWLGIPF